MTTRKPGELYQCPQCGAVYPHDEGYQHAVYDCVTRRRRGAKGG